MTVKTERINDHLSRIVMDGRATPFVIEKGDDPKWGEHRDWHIYEWTDGEEGVVMTVHRRKSDAMLAFEGIWRAAQDALREQEE